ncbi:uroporphyrinogen decarboxylase [Novosphingobium sp. FKTRR1]|uniref:uroporphyrinogen decarboxylase n=1 Tax=unclassified Novosphingobium TaxID=2644732 RepID=UPI001CF0A650|nr:uroporphyrinogen decarboxylase [Novosphingobium sp. FKTRR1]
MPGPLLRTLQGENLASRPIWLMRQAGRYLPEYRALRADKGGFLALVYDSEAAAEITLQPIKRFGFDGAILFSDILIVPYAMGQNLEFLAGEGPRMSPRLLDATLESLQSVPERLEPIYRTVGLVRDALAATDGAATTLLGFAGSPWTVATYMVAGEGSRDHHDTRAMAYRDPVAFQAIIDAITEVTIEYLAGQAAAGAEGLQLFDSWAGSLAPAEFERWVIAPNARIASAMHARYPDVPIIGFPKGAGEKLAAYARETGVDAVGVDETIDPLWAARELPSGLPVQGNLDPLLLLAGGPEQERQALRVLDAFADRPHVFNLGHGIGQFTPIAHVEQLLATVRGWSR